MIYWTSIPTFTLSSLIRGLKSILPVSIRNLKSFFIPLFLMPLSNWSASSLTFRTYPKHGHFSQHLHTTVQADSSCLDPCKRLPTELPASTLVPPPNQLFQGNQRILLKHGLDHVTSLLKTVQKWKWKCPHGGEDKITAFALPLLLCCHDYISY